MNPIAFSQLVGNEEIKAYLTRMIDKKAVGHSLLFAGQNGIGKGLFAYVLASLLICENDEQGLHRRKIEVGHHPDIHIYLPEGKLGLHSIQTLRQLSEEVYLPPYEAAWKVFIIHDADRMLSTSANALLKTFEEPPAHTLMILLSHNPAALLPTILSRCRTVYFHALTQQEIENYLKSQHQLTESEAHHLAQLAKGSLSRALNLFKKKGDLNRELVLKTLSQENLGTYKALTQVVQTLAEQIEYSKKQAEETAKEELYSFSTENLSAQQQHFLEKELEGMATMNLINEVNALFETILSWYRDLHLLQVKGEGHYLMNKDYADKLEQVFQRGNLLSLEKVQKVIEEARLALQRSTALPICLENLFLKLSLIKQME